MISTLSKRLVTTVASLVLVVATPLAVFAGYAPADRPTYTWTGPTTKGADHVVFNSFTNTPDVGDERAFFDGKDNANQGEGGFQDVIQVKPGQEILLRTYVHNNADASLNASGAGIARNTKVRIFIPTATDSALRAISYVSADNANPGTVSDTVDFQNANSAFNVSYEPGSAMMYTDSAPNGKKLGDDIVAGGAKIGDNLDGNVPGCFEFVALVTVKVKISAPSLSLVKQVTTPGSTNWQPSLNAKVGDTVSWMITYKNTSDKNVVNGTVKDVLPAHLQVVPGTVTLVDSNFPNGKTISDTDLFDKGQNVGTLAPGGTGHIKFRTIVKNDFAANDCNDTITNKAQAAAEGTGQLSATATVKVDRVCTQTTPTPTPTTTPQPETPQLPETGAEGLAGLAGLGTLGYATTAYLRSKKSLLAALKQ